jgi:3-methyladenine DNA glycosylase AlkD
VHAEVSTFRRRFRAEGRPERARGERAYLKSKLAFYGVTAPFLHAAAREFARGHRDLDRRALRALVEALWQTRYHELRSLGIALLQQYAVRLTDADLPLVERLLRRSSDWAHVDFLAVTVAGSIIARFPRARPRLTRWSRDGNFWMRRASLLALLSPIRAGGGEFARFARYASRMIDEREFFIRKAIGWVLREASKKQPALVYEFLAAHRDRVSGLTLREGSKYLPAPMRVRLLRRS